MCIYHHSTAAAQQLYQKANTGLAQGKQGWAGISACSLTSCCTNSKAGEHPSRSLGQDSASWNLKTTALFQTQTTLHKPFLAD